MTGTLITVALTKYVTSLVYPTKIVASNHLAGMLDTSLCSLVSSHVAYYVSFCSHAQLITESVCRI